MTNIYFFYGTLSHPALLERVLGHLPALRPARAEGWEVRHALAPDGDELSFPLLVPGPAGVMGVLAEIAPDGARRLDFYETGYVTAEIEVTVTGGETLPARVYLPEPGRWQPGRPWRLADWVAQWGEIAPEAAVEFMALQGQVPAEQALARYGNIKVRAASRLRARAQTPATRRFAPRAGDVVVEALKTPYAKFFAVEDYRLRHRLFRGGLSPVLDRAAFVSGDATVVLPYDPARDRVLLVEQFRTGPLARGDANPWSLETIAGRVDAGESPEEAARQSAG